MTQTTPNHTRGQPLPVTIVPGMTVVEASDGTSGTVLGITEGYCVYRLMGTDAVLVSPWHDLALANIFPAPALLSADTSARDHRNASATVLHDLLALQQFGLTESQQTAMNELLAELCSGRI